MKVFAAILLLIASFVHVNSFTCIKSTASFTACSRPQKTSLYAAAAGKSKSKSKSSKKKAAPKAAEAAAAVAAPKAEDVVTVRKAEVISAIAEKTGMTKVDSEVALSAVLDIISQVRLLVVT